MRQSQFLPILCTVLVLSATGTISAVGETPSGADQRAALLAPLHSASFIDVSERRQLVIPAGLSISFAGLLVNFSDNRAQDELLCLGSDLSIAGDALPGGADTLNLFREIDPLPQSSGRGLGTLPASAFYFRASPDSGCVLSSQASGPTSPSKSWHELGAEQQARLEEIYIQCLSDTWLDSATMKPRPPQGRETFLAFWAQPAWESSPARYDLHVNADATEISVDDYYRGTRMYQWPWAPEEGEVDDTQRYQRINYSYEFKPAVGGESSGGELSYRIEAEFTVTENRDRIQLVSYPWLGLPTISNGTGTALSATRGGAGLSDWILTVPGSWLAGQSHRIRLEGSCDVPASYAGVGYAGVYRFDCGALWPGEDAPVDISIGISLPGDGWSYVGSDGSYPLPDAEQGNRWHWSGATRNCMVVATQFPSREILVDWGTLEVFAPAELIDAVPDMGSVKAIGPVLSYFGQLWGPRMQNNGIADENMPIDRQTVFLVPGESGVQAFEDAGLVFILGGEESYGGGGQALPVMAHELAHLWWGHGFSGPRWFVEGMANYAASKFLEDYYGPAGLAAGQGDPVGYRRYMLNFALSHALPLSLERRDALDDSGAIYHNSAGFLLTADARLPHGLDGPLGRIYRAAEYGTSIGHDELRGMFADQSAMLGPLWDSYVEQGTLERASTEDPTYRECVLTPEREKYVLLLRWLVPMRRKAMVGDYPGAIYCAERALDYRAEPKDYIFLADLKFKSGDLVGAKAIVDGGKVGTEAESAIGVQASWLLARIYRAEGLKEAEIQMLKRVVEFGPKFGLLNDAESAQTRLEEIEAAR